MNLTIFIFSFPIWHQGMRDNFAKLGMPPMQFHQRIENLASLARHQRALAGNGAATQSNKRKRPELYRDEQDMEVDRDGKEFPFVFVSQLPYQILFQNCIVYLNCLYCSKTDNN